MLKNKLNADILKNWLSKSGAAFESGNRPEIILSFATSLDGSITQNQGAATSISCEESTKAVHYIRAFCDAILVGIGTVLSDNPGLSVRLVPGNNPVPIIIDTHLRTPLDSHLVNGSSNTIIFCAENSDKLKKDQLESRGVLVIETSKTERGLSINRILDLLYSRGFRSLMVEGGAEILRSFLAEELWDKIAVTVAPVFLGGYNLLDEKTLKSALRFETVNWISAGTDQICLINRASV